MDKNRKYRADYNEAFRDEQLKWFEERMDKLPETMQINAATFSPNLRLTVQGLMSTLRRNTPSVTFSGYMETLLQIRDQLEQQGL